MSDNKIIFCGDPHGEFAQIIQAESCYKPEAIVLLGDYNLKQPLERYFQAIGDKTQIYWIHGNHDVKTKMEYEYLFHSKLAGNNLHLTVVDIGGLKVAGLGGIFAGRVWDIKNKPQWRNKQHWLGSQPSNIKKIPLHLEYAIWHHEVELMKQEIRADILVTHEAPSCHKHGFSAIDDLAEAIGAQHIFHGHHHKYYRHHVNNSVNVTGVALAGVVNLAGEELC